MVQKLRPIGPDRICAQLLPHNGGFDIVSRSCF